MSRVKRIDLWNRYFIKNTGTCLCCTKAILKRDDETTWHMGHIIGDKDRGTGCIDNLWPICVDCNNASKKFSSTYTYMAHIGTITMEKALYYENEQKLYLAKCAMGTVDYKCLGYNNNGNRCSFNRITNFCCRKHSENEQTWINKYMKEFEERYDALIPMDESDEDDGECCSMDTSL